MSTAVATKLPAGRSARHGDARVGAYPEYKGSEVDWVGELPAHWDVKRFKHLFRIKKEIAGKLGFDVLSITQRGIRVKDVESGEGQVASDYSKYQIVKAGDFAMNHMDLLTGFVDLSKQDGVTSPDYRVFALEDRASSKPYYLYLLQLCYTAKIFYPLGQGAAHVGRWRLPAEAFKDFRAPRPPLTEQVAIAKYLDRETARIDNLISEKQNFINLLKEKRQALISHVVTKGLDPKAKMKDSRIEWIGEVPEHWEVKKSKHLFEFVTSGSRGWAEYYADSGELFFRIANLTRDTINPKLDSIQYVQPPDGAEGERSRVKVDDLLISITADLGAVCVATPEVAGGYVSQHVALCRPRKLLAVPRWLAFSVLASATREQLLGAGYGGTKIQLSLQDIREFSVAVPPRDEQEQISKFLDEECSSLSTLLREVKRSIEYLQEHRTALISAAVTGKIDVRNQK